MKDHVASFLQLSAAAFTLVGLLFPITPTAATSQPLVPAVSADYFPLAVGNHWTYNVKGDVKTKSKSFKWSVDSIDSYEGGKRYFLSSTPNDGVFEPYILVSTPQGIEEFAFGITDSYLIRYPIRLRDTWKRRTKDVRDNYQEGKFEVTGVQASCVVGKFTFKDCLTVNKTEPEMKVLITTTYVNGVGPVQYVYHDWEKPTSITKTETIQSWEVKKV